MSIYHISAVTLRDIKKSFNFYSKLPGFKLVYGGGAIDRFTTSEIGGSNMYLNLELMMIQTPMTLEHKRTREILAG